MPSVGIGMNSNGKSFIRDLSGQVFGRLTVIGYAGRDSRAQSMWLCRCECGAEKSIRVNSLTGGKTKSCGCFQKELRANLSRTHGLASTPEYNAWKNMRKRCENPKDPKFPLYGGRGISVSEEWKSFESFFRDMGTRPGKEYSIDRIENDLGYCKENCRWTTQDVQTRNTRRNRWIDTPEGPMVVSEAARKFGISEAVIRGRLRRGIQGMALLNPLSARQK